MRCFERLLAWQACHRLVLEVYRATATWPTDERFGLVSQARRAAYSAAANIAEGAAKRGPREMRRFLDIALGCLAELSYILRLTRELGFLSAESAAALCQSRDLAGRLTWGLYRRISRVAR